MIGLDTNVVLRYLTQDDPVQSAKAAHLLERQLTPHRPGFISLVTIAEVVWTLASNYDLSKREIAQILEGFLGAPNIVVQNEQEVDAAMIALDEGSDFADALIAALGTWAGCSRTLTFDRKATRIEGFELLS
jgi:predicted nucleic-acid-binding protein